MNRYEAHYLADWETRGNTMIIAARIRGSGQVEIAGFLVDTWCLGVKDAWFLPDGTEQEFRDIIRERLPGDLAEAIHPARALKLIEGAVAYAQQFGFAPSSAYKKARRIFNGIDADECPEVFSYGKDGKPCYCASEDDSEERIGRVLTMLEARCGQDGFNYILGPSDEEMEEDFDGDDELAEAREDLLDWFDDHAEVVVDFHYFSGLLTALQLSPQVISPLKALDHLWAEPGTVWKSQTEATRFANLLMHYWNYLSELIAAALKPEAEVEDCPIDISPDDLEAPTPEAMAKAMLPWVSGFHEAAQQWSKTQGNILETRSDLIPYWRTVCHWKELADQAFFGVAKNPDSPDTTDGAEADILLAIFALTRALRGTAQGD